MYVRLVKFNSAPTARLKEELLAINASKATINGKINVNSALKAMMVFAKPAVQKRCVLNALMGMYFVIF